jgi:hypothetical protein
VGPPAECARRRREAALGIGDRRRRPRPAFRARGGAVLEAGQLAREPILLPVGVERGEGLLPEQRRGADDPLTD